tara:strand:- start:425 stop:868 length:444 start_codon:yes stop_codon:yes gene_type:complete
LKNREYIVESSNWRGKLIFDNDDYDTEVSRIIESSTLSFEKIYLSKNVKNFHFISDEDGNTTMNDEFDENLKLSLITKCYNKKNERKPHLHYYILNELIIKNASSDFLLKKFNTLMLKSKKEYPVLYKFINDNFKKEKIVQEKQIIS